MSSPSWRWAAAKATGTSHIRAGKGCDDFGGCTLVQCGNAETLVLVVSDGAGSAEHSAIGSRLVTMRFIRCASKFLKSGNAVESLTHQIALEWLDDIRDTISSAATGLGGTPRDFAATLVAGLVTPTHASFMHVGDGAAVFRLMAADEWQVASWPANGEYASTTYFVTDDPEPKVSVSHVDGAIGEVSIFTDGIERLVLEFANRTPFAPFFNKVLGAFNTNSLRRDRNVSRQLSVLLDSQSVCEKTDDDKTIFVAKRV